MRLKLPTLHADLSHISSSAGPVSSDIECSFTRTAAVRAHLKGQSIVANHWHGKTRRLHLEQSWHLTYILLMILHRVNRLHDIVYGVVVSPLYQWELGVMWVVLFCSVCLFIHGITSKYILMPCCGDVGTEEGNKWIELRLISNMGYLYKSHIDNVSHLLLADRTHSGGS